MIDHEKLSSMSPYAEHLDQSIQASIAKITNGLSPNTLLLAFLDWYLHLYIHPGKQIELFQLYQTHLAHLAKKYFLPAPDASGDFCVIKTPGDRRFSDSSWQQFPYNFYYESFLVMQNWWHIAALDVRGVSHHHEEVVDFTIRQFLDMLSPSNSPFTNPEIQKICLETFGLNFVKGYENLLDDMQRFYKNEPPPGAENFIIGKNVAITEGKVIYRNDLIELIQYAPATEKVYAEPILITPAWIMKYYILDLAPKHSLVKYLVDHGHTVFMISWKNPTGQDRNLSMQDYLNLGTLSALKVINNVCPKEKIHLVGYCLGGTLAAIATALKAREKHQDLATMTLFAAQVDFTEPGELGLFIDESQIAYLESMMMEKGYLDTHQMAGAFQMLRSNDLVWSRLEREYLMGERKPLTDLMAWNADATRLPYRMHSEYLRKLFLHNELAEGKYMINQKPIALADISIPIFVVATERDHVSPWKSVFKINLLADSDVTFALTSGGHNAGIVSLPSKTTKRHYRIATLKSDAPYIDPDTWYKQMKPHEGSWWPAWEKWINEHSTHQIDPPKMGGGKKEYAPLIDAPGTYVLQK